MAKTLNELLVKIDKSKNTWMSLTNYGLGQLYMMIITITKTFPISRNKIFS